MITRISLGLAIAAALPLAAQAHEAAAPAAAETSAVSTAPVAAPDALVIVRDAESGKLRPATAEEHAALKALAPTARARVALRAAAISPQMKVHRSGAVGIRMTDEMVSQSVIVRGADGKLIEACFASKDEAEAFIKSGGTLDKLALPTE